MKAADPIERLTHAFSRLPGIGRKSASRLTYFVLNAEPHIAEELAQALVDHPKAKAFFDQLTAVQKRNYIAWIATAKRQATRDRRLTKSIEMLERGEKMGMV